MNVSEPTAMPGAPEGSPRASSRREARPSGWWIALHRIQACGCTSLDEGRSLLLPAACDASLAFETEAVAQMVLELWRQTVGWVDPSGDRDTRGKRQRRLWAKCGHKHCAFLCGSSSHTPTGLQKALKEGSIV